MEQGQDSQVVSSSGPPGVYLDDDDRRSNVVRLLFREAQPDAPPAPMEVRVKNTFLHVESVERPSLQRSRSDSDIGSSNTTPTSESSASSATEQAGDFAPWHVPGGATSSSCANLRRVWGDPLRARGTSSGSSANERPAWADPSGSSQCPGSSGSSVNDLSSTAPRAPGSASSPSVPNARAVQDDVGGAASQSRSYSSSSGCPDVRAAPIKVSSASSCARASSTGRQGVIAARFEVSSPPDQLPGSASPFSQPNGSPPMETPPHAPLHIGGSASSASYGRRVPTERGPSDASASGPAAAPDTDEEFDVPPVDETEDHGAQGEWSAGSAYHDTGECKPCIYYRSKIGCKPGRNCFYCHLPHPKKPRPRPCRSKRNQCKQFVEMIDKLHVGDEQQMVEAVNRKTDTGSSGSVKERAYLLSLLASRARTQNQERREQVEGDAPFAESSQADVRQDFSGRDAPVASSSHADVRQDFYGRDAPVVSSSHADVRQDASGRWKMRL